MDNMMFTKSLTTENIARWRDRHIERLRSGKYLNYYCVPAIKPSMIFKEINGVFYGQQIDGTGITTMCFYKTKKL